MMKERSHSHLAASRPSLNLLKPRRDNPEPSINPYRGSGNKALEARRISEKIARPRNFSEILPSSDDEGESGHPMLNGARSSVMPSSPVMAMLSQHMPPNTPSTRYSEAMTDDEDLPPLPPINHHPIEQSASPNALSTIDKVYTDMAFMPVNIPASLQPRSDAPFTDASFALISSSPKPANDNEERVQSVGKRPRHNGDSPELPRARRSRARHSTID